jgi:hypothetical protein
MSKITENEQCGNPWCRQHGRYAVLCGHQYAIADCKECQRVLALMQDDVGAVTRQLSLAMSNSGPQSAINAFSIERGIWAYLTSFIYANEILENESQFMEKAGLMWKEMMSNVQAGTIKFMTREEYKKERLKYKH